MAEPLLMRISTSAVLFLLCVYSTNGHDLGYRNYSGYRIIQLAPKTEKHLAYIGKLDEGLGFELDVLRAVNRKGTHSEVLVPPERMKDVIASLSRNGLPYEIAVWDVGAIVSRERRAHTLRFPSEEFNPFVYYSYADQVRYIESVAASRPEFVQLGVLAFSFEKRSIKYLKIGFPAKGFKPAYLIDAGIHAREWIAPATALYAIHKFTSEPVFENLLRTIDIYIIPNLNPDGYEYSRNRDRLWRKTRSGPRGPRRCFGVDGNRNFPFFYAFDGTSRDPCSDIFHGDGALSEPEVAGLVRFMKANRQTLRGYISLHSYGGNILYPWGYKLKTYPEDVRDMIWAGNRMAAAIARVRGTRYKVDNSADGLYPAAGAADDYAKSIGIKYSYTLELRPTEDEPLSRRGFELPPQEIHPTVVEAFEGLVELGLIIRNERVVAMDIRRRLGTAALKRRKIKPHIHFRSTPTTVSSSTPSTTRPTTVSTSQTVSHRVPQQRSVAPTSTALHSTTKSPAMKVKASHRFVKLIASTDKDVDERPLTNARHALLHSERSPKGSIEIAHRSSDISVVAKRASASANYSTNIVPSRGSGSA